MITHETSFGRWIRNNPQLDSKDGFCVIDQDYWIHRYKTYGNRAFQLLMMVEIKTWNAALSKAQQDTLHMANQVMRNRRQTPTSKVQWQAGNSITKTYSVMANMEVNLRVYGVHVLRFSGLGPDDSDKIYWDEVLIDKEKLTGLLRFDIDPDTLRPLDLRSHHGTILNKEPHLVGFEFPLSAPPRMS
jgi:hypothetical protein